MNDIEYEFHRDAQEKKSVAAQKYRTNRRGHGALRFPSDNLTKKEWKKMNGPVQNYDLNKPMTWQTFTRMPYDLQKEYIDRLHERFPFMQHSRELVQMFGVQPATITRYLRGTLHMPKFQTGAKSIDSLQREAWNVFLECGNVPEPAEEPAKEGDLYQEKTENVPELTPEPVKEVRFVPSEPTEKANPCIIQRGHIELIGKAADMLDYLRTVLIAGDLIGLSIDWEAINHAEQDN